MILKKFTDLTYLQYLLYCKCIDISEHKEQWVSKDLKTAKLNEEVSVFLIVNPFTPASHPLFNIIFFRRRVLVNRLRISSMLNCNSGMEFVMFAGFSFIDQCSHSVPVIEILLIMICRQLPFPVQSWQYAYILTSKSFFSLYPLSVHCPCYFCCIWYLIDDEYCS